MRGARQVLAAVLAVVLVPVLLATAEAGGIERVKKEIGRASCRERV